MNAIINLLYMLRKELVLWIEECIDVPYLDIHQSALAECKFVVLFSRALINDEI